MMLFEDFKKYAKLGNLVPLYAEIPADLDTPVSAFLKIRSGKNDFLLESMEGGAKWGRYSFLGTDPRLVICVKQNTVEITEGKKKKKIQTENPLDELKKIMKGYKPVEVNGLPSFTGGLVGYLGYDFVRYIEKIPNTAKDSLGLDEARLILADTLLVFDNLRHVLLVISNVQISSSSNLKKLYDEGKKKIDKIISQLKKPVSLKKPAQKISLEVKPSRTDKEFYNLVEKAKEYIKAGDIFQVQISVRFLSDAKIDPINLYRSIRGVNPTPYLFYLQFDDMAMVGASPELMVRLKNGLAEVRPIAGTRRRGMDEMEDKKMENELRTDPKERAEHIMLVDLGRNDLGRVCEVGSVKVGDQEVVERYSHVMHLVSHVSGKLQKNKDVYDLIRATFPAGTLTGAPKIRSMEIIEELEGERRGIYGGCVGYIDFNGNTDMAIIIRTALFYKKKIIMQAAGGIVYDSVPRLEYKEAHNKARAMIEAIKRTQNL